MKAPELHQYPSQFNENRMNVLIEASSREECRDILDQVKKKHPNFTMTDPELTGNGKFVSWGHYEKDESV